MRYLLASVFLFFALTSEAQTNSLFGIDAGYGSKGIYFGARTNINWIFQWDSSKFATELSGKYSSRSYDFGNSPNWYAPFQSLTIEGISSPGWVDLITYSFNVEEKYFVSKRHFISLIAGVQNNKTQEDAVIESNVRDYGVKIIYTWYNDVAPVITPTIEQKGTTIYNANESLWNLFYGIGMGEKFGKHFQINTSLVYSKAKFSSANSLFGKTLGEGGISNPYYIPLHITAELGLAFTFF